MTSSGSRFLEKVCSQAEALRLQGCQDAAGAAECPPSLGVQSGSSRTGLSWVGIRQHLVRQLTESQILPEMGCLPAFPKLGEQPAVLHQLSKRTQAAWLRQDGALDSHG